MPTEAQTFVPSLSTTCIKQPCRHVTKRFLQEMIFAGTLITHTTTHVTLNKLHTDHVHSMLNAKYILETSHVTSKAT